MLRDTRKLVIHKFIKDCCDLRTTIQGDQKSRPPLPGRDEKNSGKMEYSISKYNLFKYYLENFVLWNPLHKMLGQFSQKMVLYEIYRDFAK